MAITGISSIDNKQIIAAGALSAISANQALVTSGGDSLQGLYDTVSTNSGSWTGGGGSVPDEVMSAASAVSANSADWNSTTDTVTANSAYWGGNALPISAGAGIKVDLVNNTLVFSNDETVLYSGNIQYNGTATLNEPAINFDRIRIYWAGENGDKSISVNETQVLSGINMLAIGGLYKRYTSNNKWNFAGFSLSSNSDWSQIKMDANYRYNITGNSIIDYGLNASNFAYIKEIVGINRLSGNA